MCCASWLVPSVVVTSACVSPRVKSAEPWVRGSTPDLAGDRAGCRRPRGRRCRLPVFEHQLAQVLLLGRLVGLAHLGARGPGRSRPARSWSRRRPRRAPRSARACRGWPSPLRSSGWRSPPTLATITGSLAGGTKTRFGLADRRPQLLLQVDERLRLLVREHQRVDDDVFASPRRIRLRPSRWRRGWRRQSGRGRTVARSAKVGLTTNLPSMRPTRTPA